MKPLPQNIKYKKSKNSSIFPLGIKYGGEQVFWDITKEPNLLLAGRAGSGKTILQKNLFKHALSYPDDWKMFAVNIHHESEHSELVKEYGTNISTSTDLQGSILLLDKITDEMKARYDLMYLKKISKIDQLDKESKLPNLLVIIDDFRMLITNEHDELDERILSLTHSLVKWGKAVGIHILVSSHSIDNSYFPDGLEREFSFRIYMAKEYIPFHDLSEGRKNEIAKLLLSDFGYHSLGYGILPDHFDYTKYLTMKKLEFTLPPSCITGQGVVNGHSFQAYSPQKK